MIEVKEREKREYTILADVRGSKPIFAKNKYGKLAGMLVKEESGWIVRTGGANGAYGFFDTREECLQKGRREFDWTFHIEE